jgi:ADP-ribose pyrophosphatase YjhB (NUDIX family)
MMTDPLLAFLAQQSAGATDEVTWGSGTIPLRVTAYLTSMQPPREYVTSARAIVFRDEQLLVVTDPEATHILPGGRVEPGETMAQTVIREVREETGWEAEIGPLLGFLDFRHLGPPPPEHPFAQPHFLHVVFVARAIAYQPEARQANGYELGAELRPVSEVAARKLAAGERLFLEAALAVKKQLATSPRLKKI